MDANSKNPACGGAGKEENPETNRVWVAGGIVTGILKVKAVCEHLHGRKYYDSDSDYCYCCDEAIHRLKDRLKDVYKAEGGFFAPTDLVLESIHEVEREILERKRREKEEKEKLIEKIIETYIETGKTDLTDLADSPDLTSDEIVNIAKTVAERTGQKVAIKCVVDCNDRNVECSCDLVTFWFLPDGSQRTERIHTY